ncbi:MAG: chromosome segregation protein SMC [Bacteroidetes bacterium]|nr:chromosome segregation protein SMC [Bacteroidota bacterium]
MYLSKLELHGFKSFADRTAVEFSDGVTVVVGPNGCGKSNIVDAVRWVIGEQRARILRSDKMDSVIFNGTSKRRSLGMAEVMLTIENTRGILPTEYSEVTIGRRLFRSGESEYLLNGVNCRLKDITDLFMDTGMGAGAYSVIELKMIEEILSDNAADRRHLFEEAAGITKYKIRRGQTLRKLKSTQGDLDRVRDLTEELEKQVRSLERQAQKASRFKKYDDRLHELELTLGVMEYRLLTQEKEGVSKEIGQYSDAAAGFTAKLAAEEAAHENLRTDHVTREKQVTDSQQKLSDHVDRLRAAESDLRIATERLATISRDLTRLDEESKAAVGQKESLQEDLTRYEEEQASVIPAAEQAERELTDAKRMRDEAQQTQQKHQVMLHNLRLQERQLTSDKAERQRQIDRLSSRIEIVTTDLEAAKIALESQATASTDMSERHAEVEAALVAARKAAETARKALQTIESKKDELESGLQAHQAELRNGERAYDSADSEVTLLQGILNSFDDLSEPVQFLASDKGWSSNDLVTVADIINCDEEWKVAVNAAMGDLASCIVVRTEKEAAQAIANLRKEEKGRATFLVLDRLPSRKRVAAKGAACMADVIRTAEKAHAPLVDLIFGSCYLSEELDTNAGNLPGRVFARTGEWMDPDGYVHAGSAASEESVSYSRIGRREQLEKAQEVLEAAGKRLMDAEKKWDELNAGLQQLTIADAKQASRDAGIVLMEAEKAHSRLSAETEMASSRRLETQNRITQLENGLVEARAQLVEAEKNVKSLTVQFADVQGKRGDAEAAFAGIEQASREAYSLFNDANITAVQTRNRLDNLKRELVRVRSDIETLERRAEERGNAVISLTAQRTDLEKRCTELQTSIIAMQEARGELDAAVSAAKEHLMETKVAISELEARLREIRRERETAMRSESDRAVRQAELATRLEDLLASFLEDFEIDLTTHEMDVPEGFDRKEARVEVSELKNKIRNLGPVNALALDSFEEQKERFQFMTEQLADLEKAESTLMTTIDEINTTASQRFETTFAAIRENFRGLFEELFGEGAAADIELADPDDLLESDVNIFAKPRGKKPSVLSQLSGGEKTLTAIALLFAIYLVKPSPFCILDEVDAPLDDANVARFMHLIRTFSKSTQFILVTHNKRTMEAADRMYGITMQEQGVSRLVGVKFDGEEEEETESVEAA